MNMGEVKLIGFKSGLYCIRVEWALKLKGVKFEYIEEEDLMNKSPLVLKYNPVYKKIPVLVHDGKPISESLVILEYINDTWKENHPSLLPQDPYERAISRFSAKFADDKCVMGVSGDCTAEGEKKEKAIESALESLAFLEKQIEGKKFFSGEQIGFMDLIVGWIPLWLNVMEEVGGMKLLDPEKLPALHEWTQNFNQIPLIKECLPPREKLINSFTSSLNYVRSLAANKCVTGVWEACLAEGEKKEKAIESALESLTFLEKQIEGKKFFGGEQIGFMEEVGGMKLLDPEKLPALHEWTQNFNQIPMIKESLPPREKLINYFTGSVSYVRSLAANKA